MRITPLDIRKQEFRRTMRGLDADEVYAFLGTVSEEYEAVLSDNKRLREHVVQLEERLNEFKTMETNLRNTLLTAERITVEAKENARREAELIVRGAEVEANKATETIRAHTQQLRREILELKKHKDNYATRLRALLESHMRVVEGFTEDFAEVDSEIEAIGRMAQQETKTSAPAPRMSRERITEDIAAGEAREARQVADKVTWGDERPREEIERPTVPGPGQRQQSAPGRSSSGSDPEQARLKDQSQQPPEPEIDFGSGRPADAGPSVKEQKQGWMDQAEPPAAKPEHASMSQARPPAAEPERGWMDQAEPQVQMNRNRQETASAAAQSPAAVSDDWRSYEVKAERQDWSSYEVPRSAAAPQPQPQRPGVEPASSQPEADPAPQAQRQGSRFAAPLAGPPAAPAASRRPAPAPNETEVEQALSGLTESAGSAGQPQQAQARRPESKQPPRPEPAPQRQDPAQAAGPAEESVTDRQAVPDDEGAAWTMEQLRRNLTNIDRDT